MSLDDPNLDLEGALAARWRLILGKTVEKADAQFSLQADRPGADTLTRRQAMDQALGFVYGPRDPAGSRADLSAPEVYLPEWLDLVRSSFPSDVVNLVFQDAIQNRGLARLLLEPELLSSLEPDPRLVAALLAMKDLAPEDARGAIRELVQRLILRLQEQIRQKLVTAARQGVLRSPVRQGSYRSLDWPRTIRRNLRHYDTRLQRVIPERFYFRGGSRSIERWNIVLLVDQSGSMTESVIHAAVAASILASLPSLRTHLVLFGSEVADLSNVCSDPVEVLLGAQIGGGTDIAGAVGYAMSRLITNPARTLLVLITDLYEGGDEELLLSEMAALRESGCRTACVLALNGDGRADFDESLAERMGSAGTPCFAATPETLVDHLARLWQQEPNRGA